MVPIPGTMPRLFFGGRAKVDARGVHPRFQRSGPDRVSIDVGIQRHVPSWGREAEPFSYDASGGRILLA
jgi:hypothetical protein